MKTDRELRDEVEALSARLRDARLALDEASSVSGGAARLRDLRSRLEVARRTKAALEQQASAAAERLALLRGELAKSKAALEEARAQIGNIEPLGDPLAETPANWQQNGPFSGCSSPTVVMVGVLAGVLRWWLT